jgi:hypothetical protein
MDKFGFDDKVGVTVTRGGASISRFRSRKVVAAHAPVAATCMAAAMLFAGTFHVECVRKGKTKWTADFKNGVTNQGLNKILNVQFQSAGQITAWYLDLITTGATLSAADTYASHAGWSYDSHFSNATRVSWAPAASTAQSSSNTATCDFTINGTSTINGIAVVAGSSTKGDTASGSGVLWSTGSFPGGEQAVVNGDTLKITYTVNASAS